MNPLDLGWLSGNKERVITCTKCGEKNSDTTLCCTKCKNKLQSSRKVVTVDDPSGRPLDTFEHKGVSADAWKTLMRMVEAWCYLLALAGVAAGCFYFEKWWPMYPAVGVLGLLIWLRRV